MKEVLNSLITNMPYPLCILDCELNLIFANRMYSEINKIKEGAIGSKISEVLETSVYKSIEIKCRKTLQDGEISYYEDYKGCIFIPIKDLNHNTKSVVIIFGIINAFTKLIMSNQAIEEKLTHRILDALPEMIYCKDTEGRYIYVNKECDQFFKNCGVNSILGKVNNEINSNKNQVSEFIESDKRVIETLQPDLSEAEFEDNNGQKIYKQILKIPIINDDGSTYGIVGRCLDITDLKVNEEKLENLSYTDVLTGAKNRAYFEYMDRKLSEEGRFPIGVIMGDNNGLKLVNDTFGHSEGDSLLIETVNTMRRACCGFGEVYRLGGDEFAILIPNASMELCQEIVNKINKECIEFKSEFFNISISLGFSLKYDNSMDIYSVLKVAEDEVYKHKLIMASSFKNSILEYLKLTLASKSDEKEDHNKRVAIHCMELAEKINMSVSDCNELKIAAELHDIGIIGIKDEIIKKKNSLTLDEFEEIKTHCERGYRIVKSLSYFDNIANSILHHHERWDGKGYPKALKGEEIPLFSRIISICDAFDVMTNKRNYRKGTFTVEEALEEIKKCRGTQFDPELVDSFVSIFNNKI